MKILVINCGSSSIKYKLYEMDDKSVLAAEMVLHLCCFLAEIYRSAAVKFLLLTAAAPCIIYFNGSKV